MKKKNQVLMIIEQEVSSFDPTRVWIVLSGFLLTATTAGWLTKIYYPFVNLGIWVTEFLFKFQLPSPEVVRNPILMITVFLWGMWAGFVYRYHRSEK